MKEPCAQVQHATNNFCIAPRPTESGAHSMDSASSCVIWRSQHGRFDHHGRFDARTLCTNSARNKQLLYSASSCGIWRSQHGQFFFKAFSNNCRSNTGVGVDHQHATNNLCIAPRLAESGAHSMDSASSFGIWRSQHGRFDHHGRFDERTLCTGSARNKQLLYSASSCGIWRSQHGRFDHHGRFAERTLCTNSARNKQLWYSASSCGIWRSQHGQFFFKAFSNNCRSNTGVGVDHQHATNDFCIAPRLAESGGHSMDSSSSCGIWRSQHGRFDHHGRFDERTLCTNSARNKRLLYSASSCGIWHSQHGQFFFKAFSNNCRSNTGVGVDHQHATNDFCIAPRLAESGAHSMDSASSCVIWRSQHGRFDHHGRFDERTLCTNSARNKQLLYSASSCEIWRSQHGQFFFKAFSNNCGSNTGVGVDHQHATNDFCIAPRPAESGAHSMDSASSCGIWRSQHGRFDHHGRFAERTLCTGSARNKRLLYSASSCGIWHSQHGHFIFKAFSNNCRSNTGVGVDHQHATNDFCIAPHLAESGAHSMDGLITMDGLMKEPCAQVQHATNDFCIAPRPAESGAHSMDTSFSRHFPIIAGPTRVWEWIINTQQTTFV